jgi:D-sedoheptulose 7-phosphate isomerase
MLIKSDYKKKIIFDNIELHLNIIKKQKKYLTDKIFELSRVFENKIKQKNKIFIFGNGGSAADSQHYSAELVVRLKKVRRPVACMSLSSDNSILTAISNDFSYTDIFSRQIEAYGKPGDVAIGLSTSANSENVVKGLKYAKKNNLITVGLLGNKGGKCLKFCDYSLIINSSDSGRVQEISMLFWHSLCEVLEKNL